MSGQSLPPTEDPPLCPLCGRWIFPESLKLYEGRDDEEKPSYCSGCGSFDGVEDDDDLSSPMIDVKHRAECTCRVCVDDLRHNHDRAQAQAFALLTEMGEIAKELRAMADRLSRHIS